MAQERLSVFEDTKDLDLSGFEPATDRKKKLKPPREQVKAVSEAAHPDANIIFGAMVDEKLDDQVWVTVVATGYGEEGRRKSVSRLKEPAAGEMRVQRAGASRPSSRRGGLAVDELEVPEFIPNL